MALRNKPTELNESAVKDENAKRFVRNVKETGKGFIYVYLWNIDKNESAPIGLFVEPGAVDTVCAALEDMGAPKSVLNVKDAKFDLTSVTGFHAHLDIYHTGKINVQWQKGEKSKKSADFANLALFDLIELIVQALKKKNGETEDEEDKEITKVKENINKAKDNN